MSDAADDEWKAIAAQGAMARRKALVPKVVGVIAFAAVFATIFAIGGVLGSRQAKREADLAEQGFVVQHVQRTGPRSVRVLSSNEQAVNSGLWMFVFAFGGGLVAGLVGFFATGGKLSAEHVRGIKQGFDQR